MQISLENKLNGKRKNHQSVQVPASVPMLNTLTKEIRRITQKTSKNNFVLFSVVQ